MKMIFLKLFLICKFMYQNLVDNFTNLAENGTFGCCSKGTVGCGSKGRVGSGEKDKVACLDSSEQRGIGHRLCPGGRDPAPESASAARIRGRGPGTRKGPCREQ